MKLPKYRIYYPDTQAETLQGIRDELIADGVLDDGRLSGWRLVQRIGDADIPSETGLPFLEVQVFETPEGTTANRARVSTVSVTLFFFGDSTASNFAIAREKATIVEGYIASMYHTMQEWSSLQATEVDEEQGLYVAYVGAGTITQPPTVETI